MVGSKRQKVVKIHEVCGFLRPIDVTVKNVLEGPLINGGGGHLHQQVVRSSSSFELMLKVCFSFFFFLRAHVKSSVNVLLCFKGSYNTE